MCILCQIKIHSPYCFYHLLIYENPSNISRLDVHIVSSFHH